MVDGLDIYRSANELIKQHGDDAPMETNPFQYRRLVSLCPV